MDSARWNKIADLFGEASDLPPASRAAFLDEVCRDDSDLRQHLESLLRQEVSLTSPLERVAHAASQAPGTPAVPAFAGPFRILRILGRGGMGVVYEAEQSHPKRTVALKVIRGDGFLPPDAVRRFERELQALARLDHPGIARIYEAGTADLGFGPEPWFAMELIRGLPLNDFCSARRPGISDRLRLIAAIGRAVQHAHSRGIVHRDLKPRNILVDESVQPGNYQPKILDFGIARFTDPADQPTRETAAGNLLGTLAYMSPEQVTSGGAAGDERSDVYSLGVIFYELLAGVRPYETTGVAEQAARAVVETEPAPLSSINRAFRGDLETIAARALEKNPARRYASAAAFADDIERHLNNQPILARPPSLLYQMRKFTVRHRTLALSGSAIFVVLLSGILATSRAAFRAAEAERRALSERDRAAESEKQGRLERDRAVRFSEEAGLERLHAEQERNRALAQSSRADREAAAARAVNEFLTNDILFQASARRQSGPTTKPDPDLKVRTALDRAAAGLEGKFPGRPDVEASIRYAIGSTYGDLGLLPEAGLQLEKSLALWKGVPDAGANSAQTATELALIYTRQARFSEAETLLTRNLELQRRSGRKPDRQTLIAMNELALLVRAKEGDFSKSEARFTRLLELFRTGLGDDDAYTLGVTNNLAAEYSNLGRYQEAAELYARLVEAKRRTLGPEHPSTLLSLNSLGVVYRNLGDYHRAAAVFTEALNARRRVLGNSHADTIASINSLGRLRLAEGAFREAETLIRQAAGETAKVLGPEHPNTLSTAEGLAELCLREGRLDEAATRYREILEVRRRILSPGHASTVSNIAALGLVELRRGNLSEAETLLQEAVRLNEKSGADNWRRYQIRGNLGACLFALGRYADAESLLLSALRGLDQNRKSIPFEYSSAPEEVRTALATLYRGVGRSPQ